MVLKLHGNSISTCTKRVAVILQEKGVPFEFIPVARGTNKTPEYKATMQPFGQIPVLDDDGFLLYESRAIGRYIALKYADQGTPRLIPSGADVQETALFERAMSIEATQFTSAEALTAEALFKPYMGGTTDPAIVAKYTQQLEDKMDAYDAILAKSKYLAGDHLTLADLFHLPYAEAITNTLKMDILTSSKRPHVARWWNDISSRPSWRSVRTGVASS